MFYNTTLDLHGYDRYSAVAETKTFINRHKQIGNKEIIVIHGVGSKIIKNEIHNYLKNHPDIESYKLNENNIGETRIQIK